MLAWDHNAYYHRLLLRQLPPRPARVLDVGCRTGVFAGKAAACTKHVDALDRSPQMIDAARESTPANVHCVLTDVMTHPLVPSAYDAIVSISTLHHLPLQLALARLAEALRLGGASRGAWSNRRSRSLSLPGYWIAIKSVQTSTRWPTRTGRSRW